MIGGGPAGSFFALAMQRRMKLNNSQFRIVILEKKKELGFYQESLAMVCREGCNYCAGGISPRMSDVLKDLRLDIPRQVIQSKIRSITVHGHWKNIELNIPKDRHMFSVYRGARPAKRTDRIYGFDSFLLGNAVKGGAELITGKVYDVRSGSDERLQVHYQTSSGPNILYADFVVFSCGLNQVPGMKLEDNELVQSFQRLVKGFKPPAVRRTLIFELEADPAELKQKNGEIYFIESGSKQLKIEMCSIIPKEQFITVVLIGKSIDAAGGEIEIKRIIDQFIDLPHIRKILPKTVTPACICRPNMAVGGAKKPYGNRMAIIGDMVVSRLYKDGILSAYHTSSALARAITDVGIDRESLKKAYGSFIRKFILDNRFGALVFMLHGVMFSRPFFSRILYQAILTERKTKGPQERKLENILWKIASGDDRYQDIFFAMIKPMTLWLIFTGGGLITLRNFFTEWIFGLDWRGIGRFTTGVYKEALEAESKKIRDIVANLGIFLSLKPEFEKMYSIKINASQAAVFQEVGKFGNHDQNFFNPRFIRVKRIRGDALQSGSVLIYEVFSGLFKFSAVVEKIYENEMIIYRVDSGFPKGGVLIFEIERLDDRNSMLTIYVAFDFPKGRHVFSFIFWCLFKILFPSYLHDVLWNHSLCKLKDIVESERF